jgi:hypothetical protein
LVEAGAKLNTIAGLMKVPMAFRGLKPGAVFDRYLFWSTFDELEDELIRATMPATTSGQRQWLAAVVVANRIDGPYVEWTARNCHLLGSATIDAATALVSNIGDWVRASYVVGVPQHVRLALRASSAFGDNDALGERYITRPFSPDMSVATVKELSAPWHEEVALSDPRTNVALPAPWRDATKIGDISVVPLDTASAIAAEGRAMHHCARTLIAKVQRGDSYLFGARDGDQRIATIEVSRNGQEIFINQMRGACNSIVPLPLQNKFRRWVRERDKWDLPIGKPAKAVDASDVPLVDATDVPF